MTIGQPYYEPTSSDEDEPEEPEVDLDTGEEEEEYENAFDSDTGDPTDPLYENSQSDPVKSGCSTSAAGADLLGAWVALMALIRRRDNEAH